MIVTKIFLSVLSLFAQQNQSVQEKLNADVVKKELNATFNIPIYRFKEKDLAGCQAIVRQTWDNRENAGKSDMLRTE